MAVCGRNYVAYLYVWRDGELSTASDDENVYLKRMQVYVFVRFK